MIRGIQLENYRSFSSSQVMTFEPLDEYEIDKNYVDSGSNILKYSVLIGPNGSGKTNFIKAINCIVEGVKGKPFELHDPFCFGLKDTTWTGSSISIQFTTPYGYKCLYKVKTEGYGKNMEFIIEELYLIKGIKEYLIMSRREDNENEISHSSLNDIIYSGVTITVPKNKLLLSGCLNHKVVGGPLYEIANYLSSIIVNTDDINLDYGSTDNTLLEEELEEFFTDHPEEIGIFSHIVSKCDFGIKEVKFYPSGLEGDKFKCDQGLDKDKELLFKLSELSTGTRIAMRFIGLVIKASRLKVPLILDSGVLRSLHPKLVTGLIRFAIINTHCQLFLATHNDLLIDNKLSRKDQVWFVDKCNNSSELFSLSDFEDLGDTSDKDIPAWYRAGKFGAVPKVEDLKNS